MCIQSVLSLSLKIIYNIIVCRKQGTIIPTRMNLVSMFIFPHIACTLTIIYFYVANFVLFATKCYICATQWPLT